MSRGSEKMDKEDRYHRKNLFCCQLTKSKRVSCLLDIDVKAIVVLLYSWFIYKIKGKKCKKIT